MLMFTQSQTYGWRRQQARRRVSAPTGRKRACFCYIHINVEQPFVPLTSHMSAFADNSSFTPGPVGWVLHVRTNPLK